MLFVSMQLIEVHRGKICLFDIKLHFFATNTQINHRKYSRARSLSNIGNIEKFNLKITQTEKIGNIDDIFCTKYYFYYLCGCELYNWR